MATVAQVTNLYRTLLGREPDAEGLNYWVNSGKSLSEISNAFLGTPEGQIVQLYQQQLGRMPDPSGLAYYKGLLESGTSIDAIRNDILQSEEANRLSAEQQAAAQAAQAAEAERQAQLQAQQQAQIQAQQLAAQQQAQLQAQQQAQQLAQQQALAAQQAQVTIPQSAQVVVPQAGATQAAQATTAGINPLITQLYQTQLGRAPDPEGAAYWQSRLNAGATPEQLRTEFARSLEGQNILTQAITSAYRQELGRNPEQEGYQYWQSSALNEALTPDQIRQAVAAAAAAEQAQRNITGGFTEMQLAALEADPYGGRYATTSIFDLPTDAVNVSNIAGLNAQFVAPITQKPVISQYGGNVYNATAGQDVLSDPVVVATINRSLASGVLTNEGLNQIVQDLTKAKNMDEVYAAFSKPQGQVIIDQIWGIQTGEDVDLAKAKLEAADRQKVIDSLGLSNYPSNFALADAYKTAGLDYPFGQDAYQGYNTMMTQPNVVTPQNFNQKINQLLATLGQEYNLGFGGANYMATPLTGQYYSETGLQPGFTPFGTEGTMFRSGVAGYTNQLPTGFQFGAPPVNATFREYRPGAFQPADVTTGGFITGYTQAGAPIYSTYADPNVNVGGAASALNSYNPNALAELQAQIAALQANQSVNQGHSQGS